MALLVLLGCEPDAPPKAAEETGAPPAEDCGTWASVGEPFVLNWCGGCHSEALPEGRRYGAPTTVNFDTLDRVREGRALFAAAALGDDPRMPPAGGVPAEQREVMRKWLECGAPGEAHQLAAGSVDDTLRGAGFYFGGGVGGEGTLMLYTTFDFVAAQGLGMVTDESGAVWFEQFALFDEAGEPTGMGDFDPPLPVWPPAADVHLTSTLTESWGTESSTEELSWTVRWDVDPDPDPRMADPTATRVTMVGDAGREHTFWLSSTAGFQGEAHAWGPASGFAAHRAIALSSAIPGEPDGSFPIEPYDTWLVRRITYDLGGEP